ncbi:hypothetical protein DFP94_11184 [Fontibacillus phaseoli]|uniref:Uncharacterized protein n=1 Tax=Fontibacillus phaseoli TaxID=1416533 RepID=A0A369B866_9BACL|nr:hypothetical protein DFP94_11184 [Fontibacillus phaseoli]
MKKKKMTLLHVTSFLLAVGISVEPIIQLLGWHIGG